MQPGEGRRLGGLAAATARFPVVMFDFDGTLADSVELIVTSFRSATLQELGRTFDDAIVRAWIGRPLRVMLEQAGVGDPDHVMGVYRQHYLANHDALLRPFPGMAELLSDLAAVGCRLAVVSSKPGEYVRLGLLAVGLNGDIEALVGLGDTAKHKPDPEPLEHAAGLLGAKPSQCVYVGDADTDLMAGSAAGMSTCGVTWGACSRERLASARPSMIVDTVSQLHHWLLPDPSGDQEPSQRS